MDKPTDTALPAPSLTLRQREAYDFVRRYIKIRKIPPTIQEVATGMGVTLNAAVGHLKRLRDKGCISWGRQTARSIRMGTTKPAELPERRGIRVTQVSEGWLFIEVPVRAISVQEAAAFARDLLAMANLMLDETERVA